ncbi:MAG: EamA family transporter RarD [Phycisphaerae bacterium]
MPSSETRSGVFFGLGGYALWGFVPLYFKLLAGVPALTILCHRALWSVPLLLGIVLAWRQGPRLRALLASRRMMGYLFACSLLIAVNWLTFIFAVLSGHTTQASLGYFMNPLVAVLLGMVVLKETLRPRQWVAIGVAAVGVGVMVSMAGVVPWVSLVLAFSFAVYALLRKLSGVESLVGLTVEVLLLSPVAAGYLLWAQTAGPDATLDLSWYTHGLLALSGVVTAAPLLLFGSAARRVKLSTLGLMQYLAPTLQFIVAITLLGESMRPEQWVAFGFIWAAVAIYVSDMLPGRAHHHTPPTPDAPAPRPVTDGV